MSDQLLFEQPLNERTRFFLRLEHLFSLLVHFRNGVSIWDSHASIAALIETLNILDRSEIRLEILKELERHMLGLSRLLKAPGVDRERLDTAIQELTVQIQKIQRLPNKFGAEIRDNELLNSVRQRTLITGGTCGFDIPAYHYWLNQPAALKNESFSRWLAEINPIHEGITHLLALIRHSALFEKQVAAGGFFQRVLETQNPCQLLRIALPPDCEVFPEVSGNKHRVNVRFLLYSETGRPKQITHNLEFELSCCSM